MPASVKLRTTRREVTKCRDRSTRKPRDTRANYTSGQFSVIEFNTPSTLRDTDFQWNEKKHI